jgi:hypothetical protein
MSQNTAENEDGKEEVFFLYYSKFYSIQLSLIVFT